jgi:hypothetical protein
MIMSTSRRELAFSFHSDHTLDEVEELLRQKSSLEWKRGDNEERGEYLRSKPFRDQLSQLRIFTEGDRLVVSMDYLFGVAKSIPYEEIRAIIDQEILPLVGARDIQPHPGWEG